MLIKFNNKLYLLQHFVRFLVENCTPIFNIMFLVADITQNLQSAPPHPSRSISLISKLMITTTQSRSPDHHHKYRRLSHSDAPTFRLSSVSFSATLSSASVRSAIVDGLWRHFSNSFAADWTLATSRSTFLWAARNFLFRSSYGT